MTQTVQAESPAALGRKQRLNDLLELIKRERLNKSEREIRALYMLQTGLRREVVNSYLKLIYEAGLYDEPDYLTDKILTDEERKPLLAAYQRKQKINEVFHELLHERYYEHYVTDALKRQFPNIENELKAEAEKIVDAKQT